MAAVSCRKTWCHGFPWPVAEPVASQADVVLVLGTRFNRGIGYGAPPVFDENVRFIQADIDGSKIGRNRPIAVPIVGDAALAAEALANALAKRGFNYGGAKWINEALEDRLARVDEFGHEETGQLHPLRMARELQSRMPDNAIVIGDGANCVNWYKAIMKIGDGGAYFDHEPLGCMGVGTPLAIGAVAAEQDAAKAGLRDQRPVFLATGDGAFGFYAIELATASRHGLPFFAMVANDGGWGANRNSQRRSIGRNVGVELDQNRYDLLAESLNCHGELAESPPEVGPAMDRALKAVASGKPALVNILVDPESGSERGSDKRLQYVTFNPAWPRTGPKPG